MRPKALDLFAGQGGMSEGLRLAGFEVTGVDLSPQPRYQSGTFVQADALTFPLEGFDYVHASPPCQSHSSLRHLQQGRVYPCFIEEIRARLQASGIPWSIENVPGAPLGSGGFLTMLCGTMFGLQTPDGRAEIRRHRLFETSFSIALRPACQHGHESLSVCGTGLDSNAERWAKRRAMSVTGHSAEISPSNWPKRAVTTVSGDKPNSANTPRKTLTATGEKGLPGLSHERRAKTMSVTGGTPQRQVLHNQTRETFSIEDARAAMQCPWMSMKGLSQAIPPPYGRWIGEQAIEAIRAGRSFS